jgi:ferric-dicitrate binding protein FerR (iron transport regulator)
MASGALANDLCEPRVGDLVSAEGVVEVQRDQAASWQRAALNARLCRGDTIRVGTRSRAAVALINDAVLRLDQNTTLRLLNIGEQEEESSFLDLVLGAFQSFSRKPRKLAVSTPYLNATIEGTEFLVRAAAKRAEVTVFEGRVAAENDLGRLVLAQGESAVAQAGQAPQARTLVKPRDAVQWSLYYPPILAALGGGTDQIPPGLPAPLAEALRRAGGGDIAGAFAALERVPEGNRDARFHLFKAALELSVGRVEAARAGITQALARDPDDGRALGLSAVIAVVQNQTAQALADARRAVALSPDETAAKIALSYAQQAGFRLEDARDTLLRAVEQQPGDALAWARLGELWLSLGYRGRALDAAMQAVALAPDLQRTQLALGFAALVRFDTATAKVAFEQAIALASADPLPRLGLGLARIRDGNLEAGRRELEIAVGLDSNNALLRAYLGKAYFEEKRAPLDAEQFTIAKGLDPFDPTAYFYDAIRQQTENKPGQALANLQAAIARNDNRAVYRGRLQLDQDRATRGTSLARIYGDLGFTALGLNEAGKSLALAPDDSSAHRFLSDSYRSVRRREIARVSELLQAQMLQDVNVNPVQPSLSDTNLNIATGGGPTEAGFNEFTPLFERNQFNFNISGQVGSDDTQGVEGVASALYDRFSISAGGFHFETDGWRDNNDIDHDIYNIFGQAAITPEANVQVEYRHRKSKQGDLAFNFDPDDFSDSFERDLEQDTARVGLRISPLPGSDILFSYIYSERDEDITDSRPDNLFGSPFLLDEANSVDDDGHQAEAQYLHRREVFNLVAGGAYNYVDRELKEQLSIIGIPLIDEVTHFDIKHGRGYAYGNINLPSSVTWTLGLSYDDYDEQDFEEKSLNPKFGVQWNVTDSLTLRGAAFKVMKPALVNNRTLEPTQVAGFNQLFDDINATKSWRYGAGIDWRITQDLAVGAEATWREMDEPVFTGSNANLEDRDEQHHRAYLYWTPIDEVAVSGEFVYDRYKAEKGLATANDNLPERATTYSVPLGVRLFSPSGFFAGLSGSWVDQDVKRAPSATQADGDDNFFVANAAIGFRFPKRLGIVSLQVNNIFNKDFKYQDDSYREFRDEPSTGPYFPERTILARATFNF